MWHANLVALWIQLSSNCWSRTILFGHYGRCGVVGQLVVISCELFSISVGLQVYHDRKSELSSTGSTDNKCSNNTGTFMFPQLGIKNLQHFVNSYIVNTVSYVLQYCSHKSVTHL